MNSVVHFELPMDNKARAMKFYEQTFGWQLKDMGADMGNYILATTTDSGDKGPINPGAINGGMAERGQQITAPSFAVDVPNIDEAMEKIKAGGGEIVGEKMNVGEMGVMVYFKDTEGNLLSLWQTLPKGGGK